MGKSLLLAAAAVAVFSTFTSGSALANPKECAESRAIYAASAPPKAYAEASNGSCGYHVNRGQAGVTLQGVIERALSNCRYFKGINCTIRMSQDVARGETPTQALMRYQKGR
jgi:hypothetical protein